MKRANGNGSITKVKGNRRKPYKVVITKGWDSTTGKQIKKMLGYYFTQKEANKALADYLDTPYDLIFLLKIYMRDGVKLNIKK